MTQQVDTFWLSKNPALRALRRWISIYPRLYIPLRRMRMADTVVEPSSDLLIEGFPRSGNTWTEALIREAGHDALTLAHHAHAAAHVMLARQIGVPSMILFRDPDDAVVSLLALYENQLDARGAFLEYIRFYEAVWPLRGPHVRFYNFTDVTAQSTATVGDLATAFELNLKADGLDKEDAKARVFKRMDEKALRLKRRRTEHSKARPDVAPVKDNSRKAFAREAIEAPRATAARAAAHRIYAQMRSDLTACTEAPR